MVVRFRRKSDSAEVKTEVEGMLVDGTQPTAVGIAVWAGSRGFTINIGYRGGAQDDWFLSFFRTNEKARIGDWVLWDGAKFYFCPGDQIDELYERID